MTNAVPDPVTTHLLFEYGTRSPGEIRAGESRRVTFNGYIQILRKR
jgi:hypothetical protein